VLTVVSAGVARAEPALWRFGDADTTVTMLGSIHALPPEVNWRGPAIDHAIAEANLVVFEMRQNPSPEASHASQALMTELGRAKDSRSLSSRLSPQGRARLARHAAKTGLTLEALDGMTPWYAAFQLEWAGGRQDGGEVRLGVEKVVLDTLRPDQKTDALEEQADVVRILSGYPEAEQVRMLEGVLEAMDDPARRKAQARALELDWASGRLARIQAETARLRAASPTVHDQLVADRNRRWTARLVQLLDEPGKVLVVVGAGHLAGDTGVPALLRRRGLRVTGPDAR
jgi:uncharacterized protein YbaP (TraB family)